MKLIYTNYGYLLAIAVSISTAPTQVAMLETCLMATQSLPPSKVNPSTSWRSRQSADKPSRLFPKYPVHYPVATRTYARTPDTTWFAHAQPSMVQAY